jgi:hypothetical protein
MADATTIIEDINEPKKVSLHVVHTACRDCVFATYPGMGRTQTGCELKRLDKYREQGTEVLEAVDETGDEFFIVNGRKCLAHRDKSWADRVPEGNRAATVRAELTTRTDVVVPLGSAEDLDRLPATLDSLRALELKPATVTVVNNSDLGMGKAVSALAKTGGGLNWQVTDIKERAADGGRVDLDRAVDIAAAKFKGHFYTLLPAGETLPPSFTADLDRAVVDDLGRFVLLLPNERMVGLTVALGFHRAPMVDGNKPLSAMLLDDPLETDTAPPVLLKNVVEKAAYIAERQNLPHLVERAEVVCPSLS